jgi:hypothetical protein
MLSQYHLSWFSCLVYFFQIALCFSGKHLIMLLMLLIVELQKYTQPLFYASSCYALL